MRRHGGLLVVAIVLVGFTAASRGAPALFLTTPLVAGLVYAGLRRTAASAEGVTALPFRLQRIVDSTLEQLPQGEGRALLTSIVAHAQPAFERPDATFDARENEATCRNVSELVEACCATAVELARLDRLSPQSDARALFVARLDQAGSALAALYDADVRRGTPASERVGELAAEIKADARARSAAKDDLRGLLGEAS